MYSTLNLIKDFISDNLAGAVSTVEAKNSITITPYKVLQIFTAYGRQFPSITVHPTSVGLMTKPAGNARYFANPVARDKEISIQIWARGNSNESRTVETDVVGYGDALEELFKGEFNLTGVKGVEILETTYTELFPDISSQGQKNLLLKGATFRIKVRYNII